MRKTTVWVIGSAFAVSACALSACTPSASTEAVGDPTSLPPSAQPTEPESPVEMPSEGAPMLPDEQATQLMYDLAGRDRELGVAAIERVLETGDQRFVPVLIEMLRGTQVGMFLGIDYGTTITALETLSGQPFGDDWPNWIEWYGDSGLEPPPGFTGWKGELLSAIDPRFADFLNDDAPSDIRVEEIQWGGVAVDGIPALDNATMIPPDEADYLLPEEPVFGVSINGDARAYPLRILDWHEMANDVVGGVPMSLAYCTLCGAGIAFDGRAPDGNIYDFGSSGFLYRSNKLMYDRQTRTLWNQLTGEPVLGELVGQDIELDLLPVVLTSWEDWRTQHPETRVLDIETGHQRQYLPGAAYGHYFAAEGTMFPVWQRSDQLATKERVYALRVDGTPKAYPLDALVEENVVNDTINGTNVVLIANRGRVLVAGQSLRAGDVLYDSGGEVRAYESEKRVFSAGPTPDTVIDSAGIEWQVTEVGLLGPEGDIAPRISGHLAYWFGWFAFFPNTLVYGGEG